MSKRYQKSAKDLAFDRERTKLNATIMKLKSENTTLRTDNERLYKHIDELKGAVSFYQSEIELITGMGKEEFLKDVERRKGLDSVIKLITLII